MRRRDRRVPRVRCSEYGVRLGVDGNQAVDATARNTGRVEPFAVTRHSRAVSAGNTQGWDIWGEGVAIKDEEVVRRLARHVEEVVLLCQ